MSESVSQIKYWLEGSSFWNNNKNEHGDDSAAYLSYDVFLGLSVIGGFFALDHLYLRSPLTFLAKFLVNIFGFGIWWVYDALHAVFNTDVIKIYGLSIPGLGPQGIAAGVLANPEYSKKHWRFFVYAVALFFGGMFGLDSFLVGDRRTGIMRLLSLISIIMAPIALLWWAYKVFQFFTNTKAVVNQYSTYFGSVGGESGGGLFGWLFDPLGWIQKALATVAGPIIEPIALTAQAAIGTVDKAVDTAGRFLNVGETAIKESSKIISEVSKVVDTASQGLGGVVSATPGAALYSAVTPEGIGAAIQKESGKEKGTVVEEAVMKGGAAAATMMLGNHLNVLPYLLLGTLTVIVLAGFIVTYQRSDFNHAKPQDDIPPQPGVLRESDRSKARGSA
jgi:hypothetical protein